MYLDNVYADNVVINPEIGHITKSVFFSDKMGTPLSGMHCIGYLTKMFQDFMLKIKVVKNS